MPPPHLPRRLVLLRMLRWMTCCYGLALLSLLHSSLRAEAFSTKGFYTVTGPEYDGKTHRFYTSEYYPTHSIPSDQDPVVFCTRICVRLGQCKSFLLKSGKTKCQPTKFNLCTGVRWIREQPGVIQYDVIDGNHATVHKTCAVSCLEGGTCASCGHGDNCSGEKCDECVNRCWEMNPNAVKVTEFLYLSYGIVHRPCDMQWQLVWDLGSQYLKQIELNGLALKLKLVLMFDNGDTRKAYFDGVSLPSQTRITVGASIAGGDSDTPNNWGAPFNERAILTPSDNSCRKFFYADDPCPGNTTASPARYIWPLTGGSHDNIVINKIQLWVTLSTNPN